MHIGPADDPYAYGPLRRTISRLPAVGALLKWHAGASPGLPDSILQFRDRIDGARLRRRDEAGADRKRLKVAPVGEVLAREAKAPMIRLVGDLAVEGDEGRREIEIVQRN